MRQGCCFCGSCGRQVCQSSAGDGHGQGPVGHLSGVYARVCADLPPMRQADEIMELQIQILRKAATGVVKLSRESRHKKQP